MSSERWRRMSELFEAAVEMPPGRRDEFLRRECGDDRRLLELVVELLEADRRAGGFLEQPLASERSRQRARALIHDHH